MSGGRADVLPSKWKLTNGAAASMKERYAEDRICGMLINASSLREGGMHVLPASSASKCSIIAYCFSAIKLFLNPSWGLAALMTLWTPALADPSLRVVSCGPHDLQGPLI